MEQMLHFLPPPLLGVVSVILLSVNTLWWAGVIFLLTLVKLVIPIERWRQMCSRAVVWAARSWVDGNQVMTWLTQKIEWDVRGVEGLKPDGWYMVVSNHRSWMDIPVLQRIFNRRIPFLKFFLKQELIWVPVLGFAWWALDFPFMKRYSREQIERQPDLRGKDLETTRRACRKYRFTPVSIINFLEGTRFTAAKRERQQSPYRHLLLPKAGGLAFALAAMGEYINEIVNVTIVYPVNRLGFWDILCGRLERVIVRVERLAVPEEARTGDYATDSEFRRTFQEWVNQLWQRKDELIDRILADRP
jgi:1-acyl-sn-glycerol-3-phosphate acyltransferase